MKGETVNDAPQTAPTDEQLTELLQPVADADSVEPT